MQQELYLVLKKRQITHDELVEDNFRTNTVRRMHQFQHGGKIFIWNQVLKQYKFTLNRQALLMISQASDNPTGMVLLPSSFHDLLHIAYYNMTRELLQNWCPRP